DAALVGDVFDLDAREVGLPGQRAKARELRTIEADRVVPFGPRVGERLEVLGRARRHCGSLTCREARNRLFSAVHTTSAAGRLVFVPRWGSAETPALCPQEKRGQR